MAQPLSGVDYLGRCYDIFDFDPMDMAGSVKLPTAVKLSIALQTHLDYELPAGINFSAPRKSTVFTTEGLIYNSSDFTREIGKSLDLSVGFEGIGSFGASESVKSVVNETASRKYVFKYVVAVVRNFVLELRDDLSGITIAPEFESDVKALPADPSPAYQKFIRKFGTHFASRISLGGMAFQSVRTDAHTYRKSRDTQEAMEANASLEMKAFSAKSKYEERKAEIYKQDGETSLTRSTVTISGATGGTSLPEEWFSKLENQPIPLPQGARLRRLTELFTPAMFPDDSAISKKRKLLEDEIIKYSDERGGQIGEDLRYGDRVHLYVRLEAGKILLRANSKEFYLQNSAQIARNGDKEATVVLHDPKDPSKKGHLIYTSGNPNECPSIAFWIEGLNGYLSMTPDTRPGYAADPEVSRHIDYPRNHWITRCVRGTPGSSSTRREPLVSGDEMVICRWDTPTRKFFQLGQFPTQDNRMFIPGTDVDPLYSESESDNFSHRSFVLAKIGQAAARASG